VEHWYPKLVREKLLCCVEFAFLLLSTQTIKAELNECVGDQWLYQPLHCVQCRHHQYLFVCVFLLVVHSDFRLLTHKATFDKLYHLCEPDLPQSRALNPAYCVYRKRHKLLITLNWLAQVHTSRQLRNKSNVPHNTFTASILRPTIAALHKVLVPDEHRKTIVCPSSPAELQAVADGFLTKYNIPDCVGAIDGSLIPPKKPKSAAVGGGC
jgi:hypothetical protein